MYSKFPTAVEMSTPTTLAVDEGTTLSSVHPDVIRAHIFTRLDGPTLASASCASTQLHSLSTEESLWTNICHSTWPSCDHPRIQKIISGFPNGSRSFFSDSSPHLISSSHPQPLDPQQQQPNELISAVDIHYKNNLIFSKVQETETVSGWFRSSPFRIDLLEPKDVVPTPIRYKEDMWWDLEEDLTLSWIIVDPIGHRAANLSTRRPVCVQRHWLTGEIQVRFGTILSVENGGVVQCGIVATFGSCEAGGEIMQVKEVSLQVEDMDGINLNGKESLGVLVREVRRGERKKGRKEEGKDMYEEYLRTIRERREKRLRREGRLDSICVGFGVSILAAFWMLVMCT